MLRSEQGKQHGVVPLTWMPQVGKLSQWFLPTDSSKCIPGWSLSCRISPVHSLSEESRQLLLKNPSSLQTHQGDWLQKQVFHWGGHAWPLVLSHVWCHHTWEMNIFKPAMAVNPTKGQFVSPFPCQPCVFWFCDSGRTTPGSFRT